MRDFPIYRRSAIRYWERRRVLYNLVLIPPAMVGYFLGTGLSPAVGDPPHFSDVDTLGLFGLSALAANLCYMLAYALEFLFGSDEPASNWTSCGRPIALWVGILLAVVLTILQAANIGYMRYPGGPPLNESYETNPLRMSLIQVLGGAFA